MCKDKVICIITTLSSLPEDILLKIASLLQVRDVCALGCCSNFFNQLCFSDSVWHPILTNRWPFLHSSLFLYPKTCKRLYFERLTELGLRAASVETFLKASTHRQSLEVGDYLKAFETINAASFGFQDVQMFMFKPQMNVMLNLVAVHYCMAILGIRGENLAETLRTCEISHRQVCVKWWKVLGRMANGYRRRDESHICWISLGDFAIEDDEPLLGVLRRGTIHEVLHVQISSGYQPIPFSFEFIQR